MPSSDAAPASAVAFGGGSAATRGTAAWTFLTNHAHVLLAIARDPHRTLRDVAHDVGITERATQKIVADLEAAGYLARERHGRRNRYTITGSRPFRHPLTADHQVDELLGVLVEARADAGAAPAR